MKKIVICLLIFINLIASCSRTESQQAAYHKISAEAAYKMMLELKDYILLDVRTENEYKEKRIPGAILIPDYEVKKRAEKELPDKNKVILLYCRSGRRSASAARDLVGLGYANVYDFGGIISWPYKTETGR